MIKEPSSYVLILQYDNTTGQVWRTTLVKDWDDKASQDAVDALSKSVQHSPKFDNFYMTRVAVWPRIFESTRTQEGNSDELIEVNLDRVSAETNKGHT